MDIPKEAAEIVVEWSRKNPPKTRKQKFVEVFGVEPRLAGFQENHTRAAGMPVEWWDSPYEEPKEE